MSYHVFEKQYFKHATVVILYVTVDEQIRQIDWGGGDDDNDDNDDVDDDDDEAFPDLGFDPSSAMALACLLGLRGKQCTECLASEM